jgi:hypothetical protein
VSWVGPFEKAGVEEDPGVVVRRRRIALEAVGELLVGQLVVQAEAQDAEPDRAAKGFGLRCGCRCPIASHHRNGSRANGESLDKPPMMSNHIHDGWKNVQ